MLIALTQTWDGRPAPTGSGGRVRLFREPDRLSLSWDLRLPQEPRVPSDPVGFLDGLWEHDVVELFLGRRRSESYLELEIGPGGHWLALRFEGRRQRVEELRSLEPELINRLAPGRWRGQALFPLAELERLLGRPPWSVLACAALGAAGTAPPTLLSWPRLPGETADFHQPAAWAPLVLEARSG